MLENIYNWLVEFSGSPILWIALSIFYFFFFEWIIRHHFPRIGEFVLLDHLTKYNISRDNPFVLKKELQAKTPVDKLNPVVKNVALVVAIIGVLPALFKIGIFFGWWPEKL